MDAQYEKVSAILCKQFCNIIWDRIIMVGILKWQEEKQEILNDLAFDFKMILPHWFSQTSPYYEKVLESAISQAEELAENLERCRKMHLASEFNATKPKEDFVDKQKCRARL